MKVLSAAALAAIVLPVQAEAALVLVGQYEGNDCGGGAGGFNNCFASQTGTAQGSGDAAAIAKFSPNGLSDISNKFPSVNGGEFTVTYTGGSFNQLAFSYTPGAGDPAIHYIAIKQASGFALFYDESPITSGLINLSPLFPRNPGWSHITFFGSAAAVVPEPATWAMLILGFGVIGSSLRRLKVATHLSYAI